MKLWRGNAGRVGFTMVELMVALMIAAMLMAVVYRIWSRLTQTAADISATSQYYQMASLAIEQLRMDFKSALSVRRQGSDTIIIVMPSSRDWTRDVEVRYSVVASGQTLVRSENGSERRYSFSQFVSETSDRLRFDLQRGGTP